MVLKIEDIDPEVLLLIEDRLGLKVGKLPDTLVPRLLAELGDPPDPKRITRDLIDDIEMEIQDRVRKVVDRRFEKELERISALQQREILFLIGTPPRIERIPETWWAQKQREMEASLVLFIATAYGISANWHGMTESVAAIQAEKFSLTRARELAAGWVRNTKEKLSNASQDNWGVAAVVVAGASAIGRQSKIGVPLARDIKAALSTIFTKDRTSGLAVTEVTKAINTAGEEARSQTGDISQDDIWYTMLDSRVCKKCKPLHGKGRSVWEDVYPYGAPGHINCRCRIRYAVRWKTDR